MWVYTPYGAPEAEKMLDVLQSLETKDVLRLLETLRSNTEMQGVWFVFVPQASDTTVPYTKLCNPCFWAQAPLDLRGQSQRVITYTYVCMCRYVYVYWIYIYIHIIRFISLNYTVVPRAPDFSALFKGGVWRPSPQGSGDCQVHWMSLVTSKMFFG